MTNAIPYTITDKTVVMNIDGKQYSVHRNDDRYSDVVDAIRSEDFASIPNILDIKGRLISESNGGLYLLNGMLRCGNYKVPPLLASRIIKMFKEGFNITPLTLFLENLMNNPSERSREQLYGFIEACDLPITADGHFLAYKMVTKEFKDIYTRSMDNSIGAIVEMPRQRVDDNPNRTCSSGLHFCSEGYLGHYGTEQTSQVVVVKINPADVVSIPTDYNNAKGRACRYEIVDALDWNEVLPSLFTDEHSDLSDYESSMEDLFDNDPAADEFRWEVWEEMSDEYIDSFETRQEARDYVRMLNEEARNHGGLQYYTVRDTRWDDGMGPPSFDEPDQDEPDQPAPPVTPTPHGAVLSEDDVREIWDALRTGEYDSLAGLAREYGVSDRTIRRIRDGESWVHITGNAPIDDRTMRIHF